MWNRTPLEEAADMLRKIREHHGRAMLIGGAALFMYGKPMRSMDYDFWVRMAKNDLVRLLEADGFEVTLEHPGRVTAYFKEAKFDFFIFKKRLNHDRELVEFDEMEARSRSVDIPDIGTVMIPSPEDMIKLKKLGDTIRDKDIEDIEYLEKVLLALKTEP